MNLKKITWRRAVGWLLAIAILFFLGRTLWTSWDQVAQSGFTFQFNLPLFVISIFLLVPGRTFAVEAWRRILKTLGNEISLRFAVYAWFVSNLARFIPGNVFQLAAMMMLTEAAGVSKINIVLSQTVYAAIALSVAALFGVTLLPIAQDVVPLIVLAFAALIVMFALPAVFQIMLNVSTWFIRKVRRNREIVAPRVRITFWQGLVAPIFSMLMWTINGFAFWLFVRSLTEISPTAIPAFIAMNAAAYFIGYASFITPSGLGFREASLAFFLGAFFPAPVAVSIAFLTRLWSIGGELLGVGFSIWLKPRTTVENSNRLAVSGEPLSVSGNPSAVSGLQSPISNNSVDGKP